MQLVSLHLHATKLKLKLANENVSCLSIKVSVWFKFPASKCVLRIIKSNGMQCQVDKLSTLKVVFKSDERENKDFDAQNGKAKSIVEIYCFRVLEQSFLTG